MGSCVLYKFVAEAGSFSRRKTFDLIKNGKVRVNDKVVLQSTYVVNPGIDKIFINNELLKEITENKVYIALYKPVKYISDLAFKDDRNLAVNLIDTDSRIFPVGRLDYHSEGLIIFTNDGEFSNVITHPRYEIEKEYLVKFKGYILNKDILSMKKGIIVDGINYSVKDASVIKKTDMNTWVKIILSEGKNRIIRKIGNAINHPVMKLIRIRIGPVLLKDMKAGEYRNLTKNEIYDIYKYKEK